MTVKTHIIYISFNFDKMFILFLLFFIQDDILGSFGVGPAAVSVQPVPIPILTLASKCTLEPQQFQAKWVALPVASTFQV